MWTLGFLGQFISGIIGTLGFSLMFRLDKRHLPFAMIGGGITFFVYYVVFYFTEMFFASAFFASAVSAIFAEFMSRARKAPTFVFILPCGISIVPGGSLYRTMHNLIAEKFDLVWKYLAETLTVTLGIAGGLAAISLVFNIINELNSHIKAKKAKKKA